jgi:hypothetical protein
LASSQFYGKLARLISMHQEWVESTLEIEYPLAVFPWSKCSELTYSCERYCNQNQTGDIQNVGEKVGRGSRVCTAL